MGSIWLDGRSSAYPSVVDVLRAGGVTVATYDGWQTRSRGSGGFDRLLGIVHHHTASKTSPANDLAYMVHGNPDAPVSNGLLDRTGTFTVIAAGASNHAGSSPGPRGPIPTSSANANCFGIEAANDGVGEPWPAAQTSAYLRMTRALSAAYGWRVDDPFANFSHHEWTLDPATGGARKIDPAGPSPWPPINSSQTWSMDAYRADAASGVPDPDPEEDEMAGYLYKDPRWQNVWLLGQGPATSVPTPVLQKLTQTLGPPLEAAHDQTLEGITWQAWGCNAADAAARKLLV